jgi:hypothetical protein
MTKPGPLSKIEKFYIENNFQELSLDQISKDLDRAKSVVKAYTLKCATKTSVKKQPTQIAEQIVSNGRGSTVMTENGSVLSDEFRSNPNRGEKKRPSCTVEIR